MNVITYGRVSNQNQKKQLKNKKDVEIVNENGCSFLVCHKCGGTWFANTLSKWVTYPKGKFRERKRYPKAKCPVCE